MSRLWTRPGRDRVEWSGTASSVMFAQTTTSHWSDLSEREGQYGGRELGARWRWPGGRSV